MTFNITREVIYVSEILSFKAGVVLALQQRFTVNYKPVKINFSEWGDDPA